MRLLGLLLLLFPAAAAETHFEIDLARAESRTLLVTAETTCAKADCDFQMPVWNALYQVRDFAQFVTDFAVAGSNGEPLPVRRVSPSSWRVQATPGDRVRVRYRYFADAPGPFGCSASSRHVFLNFAQVLIYPVDGARAPMSVKFLNRPPGWKTALELPERDGVYLARHYDELADAPAELSAFSETEFRLAGKRVRLVVDANPQDYDLGLLKDTVEKVARASTEIMQEVPFSSYTLIYHFREGGGGGMEHANSTAIEAGAPCRDCSLGPITSHEFFHLWNVKRIRPQSLEPIDYARGNITPSLWFCEGVTSTYGAYIQLQAGLLDRTSFLKRLADQITRYESMPARLTQSAEESSVAVWLERYPSYSHPSRSVSYYLKGELAGYLLDLEIRHRSGNRRSLDDLMRRLNREYAHKGKFFEDTKAIERLAGEEAGGAMSDFFDRVLRSASPIDWDRYLGHAGYRLVGVTERKTTLGIEVSRAPGQRPVVIEVEAAGPGEKAGLRVGDGLLSVNGHPLRQDWAERLDALALSSGASLKLDVDRQGSRQTLEAAPGFADRTVYRIEDKPSPGAAEKATREGWLRSRR